MAMAMRRTDRMAEPRDEVIEDAVGKNRVATTVLHLLLRTGRQLAVTGCMGSKRGRSDSAS
jgi:hypothetical protein